VKRCDTGGDPKHHRACTLSTPHLVIVAKIRKRLPIETFFSPAHDSRRTLDDDEPRKHLKYVR